VAGSAEAVAYPASLSAVHNVMSMLVLTFVGAHLAAVLLRDAAAKRR
jgi:cytochrome b561